MREIKFRVWDIEAKTMETIFTYDKDATETAWYFHPKDEILMQYTGLKDKNGTDIYEGDLVEFSRANIDYKYCPVRYSDALAAFVLDVKEALFLLSDGVNLEVIGNIYESPTLLDTQRETEDE